MASGEIFALVAFSAGQWNFYFETETGRMCRVTISDWLLLVFRSRNRRIRRQLSTTEKQFRRRHPSREHSEMILSNDTVQIRIRDRVLPPDLPKEFHRIRNGCPNFPARVIFAHFNPILVCLVSMSFCDERLSQLRHRIETRETKEGRKWRTFSFFSSSPSDRAANHD